jgi:myo-inositol-1(or 4)-monophosphatase
MFYAEKNNGAYFNNKRIRVSKRKKIEECLFASGEIDNENIKQKTNAKLKTRKSGSAALDMAYVASGRYDGYFQKNLNLWDIAAGIIIVKEAGGQVNDLNLKQNNNIDITASSSSINEQLLKNLINF